MTGTLKVVRNANGAVTYSADLDFDGGVYAWNPVTQKWNKLGSVDVGLSVSGNKLKLHAFGHTFTLEQRLSGRRCMSTAHGRSAVDAAAAASPAPRSCRRTYGRMPPCW